MNNRKDYIKVGTKRRSGLKSTGTKFIVAHDTGNAKSTARNNVDYYKRTANEMSASAHLFVDDKECVECIPLNEKAWHVLYEKPQDNRLFGYDANDAAIGVELCYFPNDKQRSMKSYDNYVLVIANLCRKYNLNPFKHIVGHSKLDPGRKTDPENAFKHIGKTFESFIKDVNSVVLGVNYTTNKERCMLYVRFSPTSTRLKPYKTFLDKEELKYYASKENEVIIISVAFAVNSSRYGKVIKYLEEQNLPYKTK